MSSSTTDPTTFVDVPMPQMGVSVAEGTVVAWSVAVGDTVEADQTICEISTDKIDTEVPSPVSGIVAEILAAVGDVVEVGVALARVGVAGSDSGPAGLRAGPVVGSAPGAGPGSSDPTPPARSADAGSAVPTVADPAASAPSADPAASAPPSMPAVPGAGSRRYSPVVQRVAEQHGIDLALVPGTGRGRRVTKKDVLAHIENSPAPGAPEERPLHSESPYRPDPSPEDADRAGGAGADLTVRLPAGKDAPATGPARHGNRAQDTGAQTAELSRMRQSIGAAMRRSLDTAATCTTIVECDLSRIERTRKQLGLTALPLVARATIETLAEYPDLNATLDGTTITRHAAVHLGVAVSLGDDGLIVPVIHDAQDLAPEGLGHRIKDLAMRARAKRLLPDEVQGATFTITNPGAFGAIVATPVIDIPQVAILDLEAIVRRPVVVTDADGNEAIAIRPMVNLCMSWDHRALDGVYAARFLTSLRRRMEES